MAKRRRGFTREKYDKWLKEGRGQGQGCNYKPWLRIQDVPSTGKSSRLLGIKTQRQHEFLSNNESNYFFITEFSDLVKDVREQFPLLPIEETISIAQELGIKHPCDPMTQEEIVITTDFLITILEDNKEKILARTVKEYEKLNSKRQMEKFEVERRYWAKRDVNWGVVTEREINKVIANNIELVYQFNSLNNLKGFESLYPEEILKIADAFKKEIIGVSIIRTKAQDFEEKMLLEIGTGISLFKHLIITKQVYIDMTIPLNIDIPIIVKDCKYGVMKNGAI